MPVKPCPKTSLHQRLSFHITRPFPTEGLQPTRWLWAAHFFLAMKVVSSVGAAKNRHADCQIVKRKGTVYVICKSNPKFKVRQGRTKGTRLSKKGVS